MFAQFKEISAAFGVLSDPEKKQVYDEYGEDALKEGGGGGGGGVNPMDIFEQMFGMGESKGRGGASVAGARGGRGADRRRWEGGGPRKPSEKEREGRLFPPSVHFPPCGSHNRSPSLPTH